MLLATQDMLKAVLHADLAVKLNALTAANAKVTFFQIHDTVLMSRSVGSLRPQPPRVCAGSVARARCVARAPLRAGVSEERCCGNGGARWQITALEQRLDAEQARAEGLERSGAAQAARVAEAEARVAAGEAATARVLELDAQVAALELDVDARERKEPSRPVRWAWAPCWPCPLAPRIDAWSSLTAACMCRSE